MFESAETETQWRVDIDAHLLDLKREIIANPHNADINTLRICNAIDEIMDEIGA